MSPDPTAGPVVRLANVACTYPGEPPVHALRATSLTIDAGEHVAVTGPSGSGKSTLLNLIGLLARPTAGELTFDGVPVSSTDDRQLTRLRGQRLGFVFQAFHLLAHRTAQENVELALVYRGVPAARRRTLAREVLVDVGLGARTGALPRQLSGGERQRVAIARAVVGRPAVLLCDEPTGSLDSTSSRVVLDLLDGFVADGLTVVVVTHDEQVAARAGRRLAISDGMVTEHPAGRPPRPPASAVAAR